MAQILTHKPAGRSFDVAQAILGAAQFRKVPTWRIGAEVFLLRRGRGRLSAKDYFLQGAWRPGLTWAERKTFVSDKVGQALNAALNPPVSPAMKAAIVNKVEATRQFVEASLPVARTLAVAGEDDPGDAGEWLRGAAAIADFLRRPGAVPCFGKPAHGSVGAGAVRIDRMDADGTLLLGDGARVTVEALANEIWESHSRGFLFQDVVRPHPELGLLIGPVIGTLRVLTVDAGNGPEVLYTVLKTPAKLAVVDSAAGPLGGYAAVDTGTGRILRVQDRHHLGGRDMAGNQVTAHPMKGSVLPDFHAALDLARRAHGCFGERGLLGVDIMLSDQGPIVMEVNSSPFHSVYQTAFANGLLNADFLPRLLAVRDRFRAVTPKPKDSPIK